MWAWAPMDVVHDGAEVLRTGVGDAPNREAARFARGMGGLRRAQERLRGHAAVLQAVPAHGPDGRAAFRSERERVLFDQCDAGAQSGAAGGDDEAAGTGADHDEVVTLHDASAGFRASA